MTDRGRKTLLMATCTVALLMTALTLRAQAPQAPKTTEQAFKNIRVLKGRPADQLIPTMQFISAALGVECEFCHVAGAFDKDDKKPKQTARVMMEMMISINAADCDGHREVTCNTCHRGSPHPLATPVIASGDPAVEIASMHEEGGEEARTPSGPTADQVIDKYVQALGGAAAIQKVSSRVEKGNAEVMGQKTAITVYAKAPDKRASYMSTPKGDSITAYNGAAGGWLGNPGRPIHDMSVAEAAAASLDADLHFATDLKTIFTELKSAPAARIGDHETNVLIGARTNQPPVKLYFDKQSGLLVRQVRFSDTILGLNPTQIDYADYRDVNGVKTPFRWTLARPSGAFTIQIDSAQQNVPVDDAKFVRPPDPPAAPEKPSGK